MANKILKGDTVILLSGDDKGKKGKVLAVFPKDSKVLVEGINVVKRHTKADQKILRDVSLRSQWLYSCLKYS